MSKQSSWIKSNQETSRYSCVFMISPSLPNRLWPLPEPVNSAHIKGTNPSSQTQAGWETTEGNQKSIRNKQKRCWDEWQQSCIGGVKKLKGPLDVLPCSTPAVVSKNLPAHRQWAKRCHLHNTNWTRCWIILRLRQMPEYTRDIMSLCETT